MDLRGNMFRNSLALSILGALLVLAGIGLAALNASSVLHYRDAAYRHGGEAIELGVDAQPRAGQRGDMARVVGTPRVVEAAHDLEFNQSADTPVLVRHVEMFQWREVTIGDEVHYEMDWVDHPVDAGRFKDPHRHANPGSFAVSGKRFDAGLVQLGGFKLGPVLVHALPGSNTITPDPTVLQENLAASFSRYGDYLVTSTHPGMPQLGDLRVRWHGVPLQQVTIVARLDGDQLVAASDAEDGTGYRLRIGDVPLIDLFPDLPDRPGFVVIWRIASVLLASLGAFVLLVAQRRRGDPLLALGLGAVGVGGVAGMMWLGSGDAIVLGGWLVLVLVGVAVSIWSLRRGSGWTARS